MKTFLMAILLFGAISCYGEGTNEVQAIKAELVALKQEVAELKQEVKELQKEVKKNKACGIFGHPSWCVSGSSDCHKRTLRK